jgi:hypothetical protein
LRRYEFIAVTFGRRQETNPLFTFRRCAMRKVFLLVVIALVLSGSGLMALNAPAQAEADAPQDTPVALVGSDVTSYALAAPKIFWHTGILSCPPALPGENPTTESVQSPNALELVKRIATYGSTVRTLYSQDQNCSQGKINSNIVADADYIYWIGPQGLMQLSTEANPGDPAQLVNAFVQYPGELAIASDRIYAIYNNTGSSNTKVGYVWKSNHQLVPVTTPGNYAGNLQTDGKYAYYLVSGSLKRLDPATAGIATLTTGVTGYYPEGNRLSFCMINPFQCFFTDTVYIGKGQYIYTYNNNTNTLNGSPIYTSIDATAEIRELVTDFSRLFFIESRKTSCNLFCSYTDIIQRATRSGGSPAALYTYGPNVISGLRHLTSDGTYIFWQENSMVQRMAGDAAALPSINLRVTGIEVTQGIQDTGNSVLLVKNRRTFVRVYVKSDGVSVAGVTAFLTKRGDPFVLSPVNQSGTKITVRSNPNRNDLEQSFLFELPWSWTTGSSLIMDFNMNPYKVPLEPNYGDNTTSVTVSFNNSPSLSVEFFRLNYKIGNTTYRPRITQDVLATYSWIMRAYPMGGAVGQNFKPRLWDVDGGTTLGSWVNRTNPDCYDVYDDPKDDVALCASYFTNGWLLYYRTATMMGVLNVGLKTNAFYYGMISDASNNFPRGQAIYDKTSVGPSGIPGSPFSLGSGWDTDGTYADWYAAHEIGHSLGRAHPNAGSDNPATEAAENCRHSRSDPGYPYGNTSSSAAPIGPASGIMEGFDFGDPAFGIARAIYPSSQWNDMMSYCARQWISDYTYEGIYNYMIGHPSLAAETPANVAVDGDFLLAAGSIKTDGTAADFALLRRLNSVVNVPAITPGDYTLRLLDASSTVLADYAFTPETSDDANTLTFGQVVNFVAGTRTVQVIKTAGGQVLASTPVSANPPVISNVALQGAASPVSGVVTLGWTASDPDGGALVFDIAYSRDNGATFQPVAINVAGNSTQVDTATLGGSGTAILRVTASDGVNMAYADSAPFTMANKPPQPFILTPGATTNIHYGQLVNFSGLAMDAQDGTVADAGLAWQDSGGNVLGSGPLFSTTTLPVGVNVISLVATNSVGLSASASVTVTVDDDLNLPGPTLTAGPGTVGWQVDNGSTAAQTFDIVINNSGSGALDWTASESAAWLSLSAPSGSLTADGDAATLTLTADPTGLASDQTYTADLTLNNANDPTQTITIHVTLSIGDVHTVPTAAANFQIYLPFLQR